jgi:AraC-like DNA-binding protein
MDRELINIHGSGTLESFPVVMPATIIMVTGHADVCLDAGIFSVTEGQALVLDKSGSITHSGSGLICSTPDAIERGLLARSVMDLDMVSLSIAVDVLMNESCSNDHKRAAIRLLAYQMVSEVKVDVCEAHDSAKAMVQWLEDHIDEPVNLKILASTFECSPSTVRNRFQLSLGLSPMQLLASMRLQKARHELEQTDGSITAIARSVGYNNLSAFTRFIKSQTGHSPTDLRKRARWAL